MPWPRNGWILKRNSLLRWRDDLGALRLVTDEAEINGELLKDYSKRTKKVKAAAKKIGKVEVDRGNTACKTRKIIATTEKIEGKDRIGKKHSAARC